MDIYITDIKSGTRVALSMLPNSVKLKASGKFQSYDIINVGEVKIPKGQKLTDIGWSNTILPGAKRRNASYVKRQHWKAPNEIINTFENWRKNGTRLKLMVTETVINHDVYLESFTAEAVGGLGDYEYSISFMEAKDMMVYTVNELGLQPKSPTNNNVSSGTRPAPPKQNTYTVAGGDSLWAIAKKHLGNGNRYMEIYNANKATIGSNPSLIRPGQVLTLPS